MFDVHLLVNGAKRQRSLTLDVRCWKFSFIRASPLGEIDGLTGRQVEPHQIRPFVEMGTTMIPLLRRLAGKGVSQEYLQTLLAAFPLDIKETETADAGEVEKKEATPVISSVQLTQREAEILTSVAEGLSNKEIAAKLFLSPETIKKHLYNTYQKLEADSRFSAIAKAKELGIWSSD